MRKGGFVAIAPFLFSAILVIGCTGKDSAGPASDDKVIKLYTWADYIAPDVLESFRKTTGVTVHVAIFETSGTLETRMLTGNSGYDLVVPMAPYFQRQIRSGAYLPLDKAKLPNFKNLDPAIMSRVALNDPENAHGIVYAWGTFGLGLDEKKVSEMLPGVPLNSWRLIFDPIYACKLAACGINMLDSPPIVVRLALKYLRRDPNAPSTQDLADVESLLLKIRPYVRNIDSNSGANSLATGDVCVALHNNGAVFLARERAKEAKNGVKVAYVLPNEGAMLWFDMLAIPKDAPHRSNAYLLMDYLMEPHIAALNARRIGNASANAAATGLLDASFAADPVIYPIRDEERRLFVQIEDTPEQARALTRLWQKFKTGQ